MVWVHVQLRIEASRCVSYFWIASTWTEADGYKPFELDCERRDCVLSGTMNDEWSIVDETGSLSWRVFNRIDLANAFFALRDV